MTAYTGSILQSSKFGRQTQISVLAKVAWTSALTTSDTLTIAKVFPEGVRIGDLHVEVFGSVIDSNATQAAAIKVGTENDDDAFVPAIVVKGATQTVVFGTGDAITGATPYTEDRNIVITPTVNPTTGATTGTLYVRVVGRLLTK